MYFMMLGLGHNWLKLQGVHLFFFSIETNSLMQEISAYSHSYWLAVFSINSSPVPAREKLQDNS